MTLFNLESLINIPTCFLSEKPRCIDLILTKKKSSFKNPKTFGDGISDHNHLVLRSMRSQNIHGNPKIKSPVIRQKGESQNGCYKKKSSTTSFPKNEQFLPPDTHTCIKR